MSAGSLRERLRFESQVMVADEYGNEVSEGWEPQLTVAARVTPLKGGEDVMAARLSGRQPVVIQVRQSQYTLAIRPDWRAVDARSGAIYQLKSPPANMDERDMFLHIIAESGVAA